MNMHNASYWINRLGMKPHVEGGFYAEVYQSPLHFQKEQLPASFQGNRPAATHIYYLLQQGQRSAFHRIASDELWHHYDGGSLLIYEITGHGILQTHQLGIDDQPGERPFCFIQAGNWFGALPAETADFVLVGCTVAPGFDFDEFEMADTETLVAQFPDQEEIIRTCNQRAR